jgi:hypothetical protein
MYSLVDPDPHGSASFWQPRSASASNKNLDPDPHQNLSARICRIRIRVQSRIQILPSSSNTSTVINTFIFTVMRLLYDFLSLKNGVNVPSKSKKQQKLDKNKNF